MSHLLRPTLRLIIGPAGVAALACFELRHAGVLAAVAVGWCTFVLCIVAIEAWGKFQLERSRRRIQSRSDRRAGRTR